MTTTEKKTAQAITSTRGAGRAARPLLAFLVASSSLAGCGQSLLCGEGTIEKDGYCVTSPLTNDTGCAAGTRYDEASGQCVNALVEGTNGVCDDETTVRVITDAGVPICVGTGVVDNCDTAIACAAPADPNNVSICGRTFYFDNLTPLADVTLETNEAYKTTEVIFYDALGYLQNPQIEPLAVAPLDACGRYAAVNVKRPANGLIIVATDDLESSGRDDLYLTGVLTVSDPGATRRETSAWAVPNDIDRSWAETAGYPFGGTTTFGQKGVFVPIFVDKTIKGEAPGLIGKPVAGVTITSGGVPRAADDFYMSDMDFLLRTAVDPALTKTSPSGTGLMVNSPLQNHGGAGGEPTEGCIWQNTGALSPPAVIFIGERTCN